ncbi:hypothetical protein KUCAC02_026847 [Chaenocephalus aceratus]|nr:hypothetical protein KUCAC02_026847 [Chaenocephalus aceratus]
MYCRTRFEALDGLGGYRLQLCCLSFPET